MNQRTDFLSTADGIAADSAAVDTAATATGTAATDAAHSSSSPLSLRSVSKSFGSTVALADVDLTMRPGELLALVGPSGCGKSTLLRLVAGLLGTDSGRILLGDEVVDDGRSRLDPERRHVGLVFQEHALFPHLSVNQNVSFGLRSMSRREREAQRDRWLEMVGLAGYGKRYPHELSGGERQRVALARALAPRPRLLLLDEPFASLDPNLRTQVRSDVVELLRATGTPAVFVTHDQVEAMAVGDRVAVLRRGHIEQVDSPSVVFQQPCNQFVAAFMGEASFLPIHVNGAGATTELGPLATASAVSANSSALAVVRPDDLTFECSPDGSAEVIAAEFRGPAWLYTLRLRSGAVVQSSRSHLVKVDVGQRVEVSLLAGHELASVAPTTESD